MTHPGPHYFELPKLRAALDWIANEEYRERLDDASICRYMGCGVLHPKTPDCPGLLGTKQGECTGRPEHLRGMP